MQMYIEVEAESVEDAEKEAMELHNDKWWDYTGLAEHEEIHAYATEVIE